MEAKIIMSPEKTMISEKSPWNVILLLFCPDRAGQKDTLDDLVRKGRDLHRIVLAKVLRFHDGHRILVIGKKTVVFD